MTPPRKPHERMVGPMEGNQETGITLFLPKEEENGWVGAALNIYSRDIVQGRVSEPLCSICLLTYILLPVCY